jgi:transposase-like protein
LREWLNATNDSWRLNETYVRVKGKRVYLYRAVDSARSTLDFLAKLATNYRDIRLDYKLGTRPRFRFEN